MCYSSHWWKNKWSLFCIFYITKTWQCIRCVSTQSIQKHSCLWINIRKINIMLSLSSYQFHAQWCRGGWCWTIGLASSYSEGLGCQAYWCPDSDSCPSVCSYPYCLFSSELLSFVSKEIPGREMMSWIPSWESLGEIPDWAEPLEEKNNLPWFFL